MTKLPEELSSWGAGGAADNLDWIFMLLMVHIHHKHVGISRRGRDDDPLGFTFHVGPGVLHGGENSRLHNMLGTRITAFDVCRILFLLIVLAFPLMISFPFSA